MPYANHSTEEARCIINSPTHTPLMRICTADVEVRNQTKHYMTKSKEDVLLPTLQRINGGAERPRCQLFTRGLWRVGEQVTAPPPESRHDDRHRFEPTSAAHDGPLLAASRVGLLAAPRFATQASAPRSRTARQWFASPQPPQTAAFADRWSQGYTHLRQPVRQSGRQVANR